MHQGHVKVEDEVLGLEGRANKELCVLSKGERGNCNFAD